MCNRSISAIFIIFLLVPLGVFVYLLYDTLSLATMKEVTKCRIKSWKKQNSWKTQNSYHSSEQCQYIAKVAWACDQKKQTISEATFIVEDCKKLSRDRIKQYRCYVRSCNDESVRLEHNSQITLSWVGTGLFLLTYFPVVYYFIWICHRNHVDIFRRINCFSRTREHQEEEPMTIRLHLPSLTQSENQLLHPGTSVSANGLPRTIRNENIKRFLDANTVSEDGLRKLSVDGWCCCICLEEADPAETNPVVHLQCNHYIHKECMRGWIEKGHAVCCLCKEELLSDFRKNITT